MASRDIKVRVDFIKKFLLEKNMTESEFAKSIGVAHSTVNRILNGKRNPGRKFIAGVLSSFPELTFDKVFILEKDLPNGNKTA